MTTVRAGFNIFSRYKKRDWSRRRYLWQHGRDPPGNFILIDSDECQDLGFVLYQGFAQFGRNYSLWNINPQAVTIGFNNCPALAQFDQQLNCGHISITSRPTSSI